MYEKTHTKLDSIFLCTKHDLPERMLSGICEARLLYRNQEVAYLEYQQRQSGQFHRQIFLLLTKFVTNRQENGELNCKKYRVLKKTQPHKKLIVYSFQILSVVVAFFYTLCKYQRTKGITN